MAFSTIVPSLKNFEDQIEASTQTKQIPTEAMEDFESLWIKFSERDGECIREERLGTFLNLLSSPLGLSERPLFGQALDAFIEELNIPTLDGMVHYIDLGTTLTLRVYQQNEEDAAAANISSIPEENEFMKYIRAQMFRKFPKFKSFNKRSSKSVFSSNASL